MSETQEVSSTFDEATHLANSLISFLDDNEEKNKKGKTKMNEKGIKSELEAHIQRLKDSKNLEKASKFVKTLESFCLNNNSSASDSTGILDVLQKNLEIFTMEDLEIILEDKTHGKINSFTLVPFNSKAGFFGEHYNLQIFTEEEIPTEKEISSDKEIPKDEEIPTNEEMQTEKGTPKEGENEKIKLKVWHFFAKTLPRTDPQRLMTIESGASFKEHSFFEKIVPKVQNSTKILEELIPECYFSTLNDITVFEDLKQENYKTLPPRTPLNLNQVKLVVKAMAKLHSAFFILEEKLSSKERYRLNEEFPLELKETLFRGDEGSRMFVNSAKKGIKTQINYFMDQLESRGLFEMTEREIFEKESAKCCDELFDFVKPSKKFRNTLCHGDLWCNNIMFKFGDSQAKNEESQAENSEQKTQVTKIESPIQCKMVDFQMYRYNPPASDLLLFLYFCTDAKFRKNHQEHIFELYYKELKRFLSEENFSVEQILPYEEFQETLEFYKKFAVTVSVMQFHYVMMSSKMMEKLSDPKYSHKAGFEDRSTLILDNCEADEVYREKALESLLDLKEVCGV